MADDLASLHARALNATGRLIAGIQPSQWHDDTPCEGWDVRYLTNHIVAGNLWVGELMGGKTIAEVGDSLDGDMLGDDPTAAYEASAKVADAAFQAPGAMEAPAAVSYGPVPGEVYAGHRFIDVLVHGWDLAKATNQDTRLDPELAQGCLAVVEPQAEMMRGSGAYGGEVTVPADADPQTRLLALLGRKP